MQATSSSASSSTASFAKPSLSGKTQEAPQKKYKFASKANETLTSGSGSSSDVGAEHDRPLLQKMLAKKLWSKNPNHLRKRQLMPLKVQVAVPSTTTATPQAAVANNEIPSAIKLRIDYTKKLTVSTTAGNFKIPTVPSVPSVSDFPTDRANNEPQAAARNKNVIRPPFPTRKSYAINSIACPPENVTRLQDSGDDRASTTSSNEVAEISKARNTREEFYKYLGIDTNPCQEKLSPGSSTGDTNSSSQMRRSLRVKIKQNLVNNLAKTKTDVDKVKNGPNENHEIEKKTASTPPSSSDATCSPPIHSSDESKTSIVAPPKQPTASPIVREESSKLLKISYMKDEGKKVSAEPIVYKAICLANQSADSSKMSKNSTEKAIVGTSSHVFERRSYEIISPADNESMISSAKTTCAYTVRVLASATDHRQSLDKITKVTTTQTESSSTSVKKEPIDNTAFEQTVPKIEPFADESVVSAKQNTNCRTAERGAADKRRHLIRKAINFTEMFKRYKRCLRQGIALKSQLQQQIRRRPPTRHSSKSVEKSTNSSMGILQKTTEPVDASDVVNVPAKTKPQNNTDAANKLHNVIENNDDLCADVIARIIGLPSTSTSIKQMTPANTSYDDFAFSPTSITHSNASTDSAIVVSNAGNDSISTVPMLVNAGGHTTNVTSTKCRIEQISSSAKPTMKNPLNPVNGCVQAIIVHPITEHMQCVIAVQESSISFWRMSSHFLSIFGVAPSWQLIGNIKRLTNGK